MIITTENSLRNFEPWSGAVSRFNAFTDSQLDQIEVQFEELYPEGMTETQINDLFWFDPDWVASLVGFDSLEDLEAANE